MREILFRGKTKSGKWVEGNGIQQGIGHIAYERWVDICDDKVRYEVIPETVGQYTGLKDKNGNKIFEGDIVVTRYKSGEICSIGDVQFDCGVFGAEWVCHKASRSMVGGWGQLHNLRRFDDEIIEHIEVIGNIHDNPELLKGEQQ